MTMTGPYTKSVSQDLIVTYQKWYRQKPPFPPSGRPPCPYTSYFCSIRTRSGAGNASTAGSSALYSSLSSFSNLDGIVDRATNKAYAKFRDSVNEQAMMLVNIAERQQAVDSLVKNVNRLGNCFALLRGGQRHAAMKALGLKPSGDKWSRPRDASGIFLEWHFGWLPLLADIHATCNILQEDWTATIAVGKGSARTSKTKPMSPWTWSQAMHLSVHVLMQATVRVRNPNLHRASQLGLINPMSVAWELVPFSFLVDWFIPVGDFLSSYTDFVGLDLENAFTTTYMIGDDFQIYQQPGYWNLITKYDGASMRRVTSISQPVVNFLPPGRLSVTRGATAIALLLQKFAKGSIGRF